MNNSDCVKRRLNPKENANILSLITFFYTRDIIRKGFKKDIEEEDLYDTISTYKSKELGDKLEKAYNEDKLSHNGQFSIYRIIWKCYGKYYLFLGLLQFIMKMVFVMYQPKLLSKVVAYFNRNTTLTHSDAIYYASILIALTIINCIYSHNYMLATTELGLRMRTAFSSLIYRKSLKLNATSQSNVNNGKIFTLISKDVNVFDTVVIFINDLWIGLIQLIVITIMLYQKLGITILAGISFLILIFIVLILIGKYNSTTRVKANKVTDERLQTTQETLSAIKIIKMYTWEKYFANKISDARKNEMSFIKRMYYSKAGSLVIGSLVTKIALFIFVMTFLGLGNHLTAELVFFILSCLNSLRSVVTASIPLGVIYISEFMAFVKRLRPILAATDVAKPTRNLKATKPSITLEKVAVTIKNKTILYGIDLDIKKPGLNILTGRLGYGKSSLLKTIMEDYPITQGRLEIAGSISYASEEPWVFPSSIKQNILFGEKLEKERYESVLEACALNWDISTFPDGDETIVGDRGLNLSKGQQARINLARTIYKKADIYLLDDCLSSLDANIQEAVFTDCIKKFLKNKIVLLVSHNPNFVKQADNVIIMEDGTILSCAKPSNLQQEEIEKIVGDEEFDTCDIIDHIQIQSDDELKTITNGVVPNENEYATEKSALVKIPITKTKVYQEDKQTGKVALKNYTKFYKFGGGIIPAVLIFMLFIVSQGAVSYTEKLVSKWTNLQQNLSDMAIKNLTDTPEYQKVSNLNSKWLKIYTSMIIVSTLLVMGRSIAHFSFSSKVSINLHKGMIRSVFGATMDFFDKNKVGNILNRFSKDLGTVDENLAFIIYECMRTICLLIGITIVIASVNYIFIIPSAVLFIIMVCFRIYYIPTCRSLKRLDAATRSPVLGHLNASLEGITTIRVTGIEKKLQDEFDHHQDLYTSACHTLLYSLRAFTFNLDMFCCLFITCIVITFFSKGNTSTNAGDVGVAITQAFLLTGLLQWAVRASTDLESNMTSVERILEYTDAKLEDKQGSTIENWPKEGNITYENVSLSYINKKQVLKNISFNIEAKEKIGVVGRTGAGKTSIIATLFRLYNYDGTIKIDNVNIRTLSLPFLRSKIAIIPQDPVLFYGTLRMNVDPIGKYSDESIWKAFEAVKLKDKIKDLNEEVGENGRNFSSGQKQLICLARAIVSQNKIIVLDEATANMDPESDILIHETLQHSFQDCTIITIAHRLHSVLKTDRVMVVDKGQIVEFDKPKVLLENVNGMFYKLVKQANLLENN